MRHERYFQPERPARVPLEPSLFAHFLALACVAGVAGTLILAAIGAATLAGGETYYCAGVK
jgi:hypothetical protein